MLGLAFLAFFASVTADASPRVQSMTFNDPRAFGYFLGDVLRRDIELTLKPGAHVEAASIPQPGPVNYWLDLRTVDTGESSIGGSTRVRIELQYQAYYAPLDPRRLTVPGFTLKIADSAGSEDAHVPDWNFVISPLREIIPGKETESPAVKLRPDAPSRLMSTADQRTALTASAAVALATLVLLAAYYAWGPFRRRPGRPFTRVARVLKRTPAQPAGDTDYREALLKLHRAFDETAGRRLLPDDIDTFLHEHPQFAPLAPDIERLFASSRKTFYGNDITSARTAMPLAAIAALSAQLGRSERRAE
jgi:mxaA protein